jgi:hypothetical protein
MSINRSAPLLHLGYFAFPPLHFSSRHSLSSLSSPTHSSHGVDSIFPGAAASSLPWRPLQLPWPAPKLQPLPASPLLLLPGRARCSPSSTASSSSSTSSSHGAQKFQQQGLHNSSSSTLLSLLAQISPMARCSRCPRASPPWLATRLPPCLRAAAQCPVGACYVLDEMHSKPRVVDFLQQP